MPLTKGYAAKINGELENYSQIALDET